MLNDILAGLGILVLLLVIATIVLAIFLAWKLWQSRHVVAEASVWIKGLYSVPFLYAASPIDLAPDPVVIDDIGFLGMALIAVRAFDRFRAGDVQGAVREGLGAARASTSQPPRADHPPPSQQPQPELPHHSSRPGRLSLSDFVDRAMEQMRVDHTRANLRAAESDLPFEVKAEHRYYQDAVDAYKEAAGLGDTLADQEQLAAEISRDRSERAARQTATEQAATERRVGELRAEAARLLPEVEKAIAKLVKVPPTADTAHLRLPQGWYVWAPAFAERPKVKSRRETRISRQAVKQRWVVTAKDSSRAVASGGMGYDTYGEVRFIAGDRMFHVGDDTYTAAQLAALGELSWEAQYGQGRRAGSAAGRVDVPALFADFIAVAAQM